MIRLDHPNIVKYYETYIDNKYYYLVMEYIDGVGLNNEIYSEAVVRGYMKKLFQACRYIHSK